MMPMKLSTTIGKFHNITNQENIEIINEFLRYMKRIAVRSIIKIIV